MNRNEAIDIVRKNWPDGRHQLSEALETLIPELKESEDDRIRKELISFITDRKNWFPKEETKASWIAWLEKQGEHANFRNKIQIGDKVTRNEDGVLVNLSQLNRVAKKDEKQSEQKETLCDKCRREQPSHSCQDITELGRCALEHQSKQKPIMIQWQGNNLKEVIEFTGKDKNFEKWFKSFEEYEKYVDDHNGIFKLFNADGSHYEVPVGAWIVRTPDGYNVASKAVFKQKPTDRVEPKFKVKYAGSEYNVLEVKDSAGIIFYGIEDEPNHIDYVKAENCEIIDGYAIKENGSPYPTKIAVFSEQKPAWSEEDERKFSDILALLRGGENYHYNTPELFAWLKSLKDRVWSQSKQEWSEEDKKLWVHDDDIFLDAAKMIVEDSPRRSYGGVHKNQIIPWFYSLRERLKTLRPQNTWKPSKEQMEALYDSIPQNVMEISKREMLLDSLYIDLRKL